MPVGVVGAVPVPASALPVLKELVAQTGFGAVMSALVGRQLLDTYRAEPDESLPPLHSGVVGFLGYDVVREVEHLPDVPTDDRGWPDAVVSVIGDLVALDHWSQRAILISNVFVPDGATDDELNELYTIAVDRIDAMAADGATPIDEPMVSPPDRSDDLPGVTSSMGAGQYEAAVEVAEHWDPLRIDGVRCYMNQPSASDRHNFNFLGKLLDQFLFSLDNSPALLFRRTPECSKRSWNGRFKKLFNRQWLRLILGPIREFQETSRSLQHLMTFHQFEVSLKIFRTIIWIIRLIPLQRARPEVFNNHGRLRLVYRHLKERPYCSANTETCGDTQN